MRLHHNSIALAASSCLVLLAGTLCSRGGVGRVRHVVVEQNLLLPATFFSASSDLRMLLAWANVALAEYENKSMKSEGSKGDDLMFSCFRLMSHARL
jgi:hypothetical protein